MRKLRLEIDALKVDTFDAGSDDRANGTVRGHDTIETEWCTGYPYCVSKKCQTPYDTCYGSCDCTQTCGTSPVECGADS